MSAMGPLRWLQNTIFHLTCGMGHGFQYPQMFSCVYDGTTVLTND